MAAPRFTSIHATPPGGMYEYAIDGDVVRDRSVTRIARLANMLRAKHGLPTSRDGFRYVMEYMCPRLPDGFCTQPSTIKVIRAEDVKRNTNLLFPRPCATVDVIENRLATCVSCPAHRTKGFCMDCTGMIEWMMRGYAGRRSALGVDHVAGVCECDLTLVAVSASVADQTGAAGVTYPEGCWRNAKEV